MNVPLDDDARVVYERVKLAHGPIRYTVLNVMAYCIWYYANKSTRTDPDGTVDTCASYLTMYPENIID